MRYEGEEFTVKSTFRNGVEGIINRLHGYGTCPPNSVYNFAVYEDSTVVAAFTWNVPVYGVTKLFNDKCLCLTRMVALPREERKLRHISKPLRYTIKHMIDRVKYPVLVTYSDDSMNHNGYTYECAGFKFDGRGSGRMIVTADGRRKASVSSGKRVELELGERYVTFDTKRWVHRL